MGRRRREQKPAYRVPRCSAKPKWRNWQTRWTQNPVERELRVGSIPTFGIREAWNAHRRRRLPRPQRGHPRRRAALARRAATRSSASARAGAGSSKASLEPLGPREISGHPAPRRHDPRHARARTRTRSRAASRPCSTTSARAASTRSSRSAARTRSASRRACYEEHGFPVVGVPKTIDNDLSGDRLHLRLRHRGLRSAPRRSTGCTRPPSRTTA